jgi:hypothetical protein
MPPNGTETRDPPSGKVAQTLTENVTTAVANNDRRNRNAGRWGTPQRPALQFECGVYRIGWNTTVASGGSVISIE